MIAVFRTERAYEMNNKENRATILSKLFYFAKQKVKAELWKILAVLCYKVDRGDVFSDQMRKFVVNK